MLLSLSPKAVRKFAGSARRLVPKGHPENSPAFQRWVPGHTGPRPEGTVESVPQIISRPFGTDFTEAGIPGVETPGYFQSSLRDDASGTLAKRFRKFRHGITLTLLLTAVAMAGAQTPADFFHMGVTNYCRTNIAQARKDVTNGLALYPNNPWLTNLWELLNRKEQQQQKQQNQDKDKDKDQESKDQQSKDQQQQDQQKQDQQKQDEQKKKEEEQKKKEEEQKAADQKKKEDEAKQGQQDGSDQQKQEGQEDKDGEPQAAKMLRMTPQQAMQLLDMLKGDEKNMPFRPILRTNRQQRVFKDW